MALPPHLLARSLLGSDVRSLCAGAAVSRSFSVAIAESLPLWSCALLADQVPPEAPGTYSSAFTEEGVRAFLEASSALDLAIPASTHQGGEDACGQRKRRPATAPPALAGWHEASALRRLYARPRPQALARFVRLAHAGVEAEVLKVAQPGHCVAVHVSVEILNFFSFPVWVAMSCRRDCQEIFAARTGHEAPRAALVLRGFSHGTSCAQAPETLRGGSVVLCTAIGLEVGMVDFLYCPPCCRLEVGEHVFRAPRDAIGPRLQFAFAKQLGSPAFRSEELAWSIDSLLDVTCSGPSVDILIPTTRADYYAMSAEEWQLRGAPGGPPGHALALGADAALLVSQSGHDQSGAGSGFQRPELQWVGNALADIGENDAYPIALSKLLYSGSIELSL